MSHRALLVTLLAASSPALASQEVHVDPYAGAPVPHATSDDAVPAPRGVVQLSSEVMPAVDEAKRDGLPVLASGALAPVDLFDRVHFVSHADGLWMRGRTYKACAAEGGFTYIPFLGASAPQNYPTTFRLHSARLAGKELVLSAEAAVSREGGRIVLDRGPVDVLYDVGPESVEQSFVLDAAGAPGDLVLELDVESALGVAVDGRGFRFDGPHGGMSYGAAIALDERGRSVEVPAVYEAGTLRLTVPQSFLAVAEGEVLVDPILSTFGVDTTTGEQRQVDVAYDATSNDLIYVYEDTFSGNDADIYRRRTTFDGVLVSGSLVFGNDQVWRDPSVATHNGENVALCVASVELPSGMREIRGRTYNFDTNTMGAELVIGGAAADLYDNIRPDVGGSSTSQAGGVFLVSWERRFSATRVNARLRTVGPDGTLGPTLFLENTDDVLQQEVVVSKSTGDPSTVNRWNVVWRNENLVTDVDTIRGVQLAADGSVIGQVANLRSGNAGERLRDIDVSDALSLGGDAPTYLVTYDNYATASDARIVVCRDNQRLRDRDLATHEHSTELPDRDLVRLGATRDRFVVTYLERGDTFEWDVYLSVLDLVESSRIGVSERRTKLTSLGSAFEAGGAAIATRFSGGLSSNFSGIGVSLLDQVGPDREIHGITHSAITGGSAGYQYGRSTPNSTGDYGFIQIPGAPTLTPKTIVASELPAGQFGLLFVGSQTDLVVNPGGSQGTLLIGGQVGRYNGQVQAADPTGRMTFTMDPASIPSPFGPVAAGAGDLYHWQVWHRDVGEGGLPTSNFTNAIRVLFE